MEITLIKTLGGLKLCYDSDLEKYKKLPLNEPIEFKYTRKRNIKFHRKFFGLINMVYQNQEHYNNAEQMRFDLTIQAGYYDEVVNFITGEIYKQPKSISFAAMDEYTFSEFYNRFIDAVIGWLGWERADILENIEQHF